MNIIKRDIYLQKVIPYIDKSLIKVFTGQRRVGKSFILLQVRNLIEAEKNNANIIFIDKELYQFNSITDDLTLTAYVNKLKKKSNNYLFIDEVQEIKNFERALRNFLKSGFDIYCTGSNAAMLSGEIATLLTGRQIIIDVHSLSYKEYLEFHNKKSSKNELINYLHYGGLPFLINLPKDDLIINEYLKNIYTSILFRDVLRRNNIRDVLFLENLVKFLADTTGSIFSAKSIISYLKSQNIEKSIPLVSNYLRFLEDAFIISRVKRMDIKGKKIFEIGEKIFFEDLGIRNILAGFRPDNIHKIMENAVYNHLVIQGYKVYIGQDKNKEIDFVGIKNNEKVYIQVSYLLQQENTIKREFGNLLAVKDNYPKYVVSFDNFETPNTYKGIKHLSLEKFLLDF